MARWINVKAEFEYRWPDRQTVTVFTPRDFGDQLVKDELADFAVERGHATEGKADAASRSTKPRRTTARARTRKAAATPRKASTKAKPAGQPTRSQTGARRGKASVDDTSANLERADRLAGEDTNGDGRADIQPDVDQGAS